MYYFLRIVSLTTILSAARLEAIHQSGEHNHQAAYHTTQPNLGVVDSTLTLPHWASAVTKPLDSHDDAKLINFPPNNRKVKTKVNKYTKRSKESLIEIKKIYENATAIRGLNKPLENKRDLLSFSYLITAMTQQMRTCELILAYDDGYSDPEVLQGVLLLSNVKQVSRRGSGVYN